MPQLDNEKFNKCSSISLNIKIINHGNPTFLLSQASYLVRIFYELLSCLKLSKMLLVLEPSTLFRKCTAVAPLYM